MMRADAIQSLARVALLSVATTLGSVGCVERDPFTANDVAAPPPCTCAAPESRSPSPREEVPAASSPLSLPPPEPTDAQEAPAPRRPGTRLRETVSLGYAGDGKLTQIGMRRDWFDDSPPVTVGYPLYGYGGGGRAAHGGAVPPMPRGITSSGGGTPMVGSRGPTGGAVRSAPAGRGPR
jgi:hypothetical protein